MSGKTRPRAVCSRDCGECGRRWPRPSALGGTGPPACSPNPTHHVFGSQLLAPRDSSIPIAVWEPSPGTALPTPRSPEVSPQPEPSDAGHPAAGWGEVAGLKLLCCPCQSPQGPCLSLSLVRTGAPPSFWKNAASRVFSRARPSLSSLSLGHFAIPLVVQPPWGLLAPGVTLAEFHGSCRVPLTREPTDCSDDRGGWCGPRLVLCQEAGDPVSSQAGEHSWFTGWRGLLGRNWGAGRFLGYRLGGPHPVSQGPGLCSGLCSPQGPDLG